MTRLFLALVLLLVTTVAGVDANTPLERSSDSDTGLDMGSDGKRWQLLWGPSRDHASNDSTSVAEARGVSNSSLRYRIREADEAQLFLLDTVSIANDVQWRDNYYGQLFGFGIRTEGESLANGDLEWLQMKLLDEDSYLGPEHGEKLCIIEGDAAIHLRGPRGEAWVMFELGCGRIHLRDDSTMGCVWNGDAEPIRSELRSLAKKYYPEDAYLKRLR